MCAERKATGLFVLTSFLCDNVKKVPQTYPLIRIVKIALTYGRSNVNLGKVAQKTPHILGFTCCEGSNDLNWLL